MTRRAVTLAILLLCAGATAGAHHSFAAFYFEEQSITLQGEVVDYTYRNPHTILRFSALGPDGQVHTYAAEWSNPGRLRRQGVTQDTLKPGELVVVTGSPGRVPSEYKVHLKQIQRPADGWSWGGTDANRRRRR